MNLGLEEGHEVELKEKEEGERDEETPGAEAGCGRWAGLEVGLTAGVEDCPIPPGLIVLNIHIGRRPCSPCP